MTANNELGATVSHFIPLSLGFLILTMELAIDKYIFGTSVYYGKVSLLSSSFPPPFSFPPPPMLVCLLFSWAELHNLPERLSPAERWQMNTQE